MRNVHLVRLRWPTRLGGPLACELRYIYLYIFIYYSVLWPLPPELKLRIEIYGTVVPPGIGSYEWTDSLNV
jgi:hypothetical protein